MAEDHKAPGPGAEIVQRKSPKSEWRRVRSWTKQNQMRGVLGRMTAGAAGRILDFVNFSERKDQQKAVSVAAKTREYTFLGKNRGNLVSKNLDETICIQSKKRRDWIPE